MLRERAADNSPSLTLGLPAAIDLALAFTGGGYFDYMGKNQVTILSKCRIANGDRNSRDINDSLHQAICPEKRYHRFQWSYSR
jgi:hypothetical protein